VIPAFEVIVPSLGRKSNKSGRRRNDTFFRRIAAPAHAAAPQAWQWGLPHPPPHLSHRLPSADPVHDMEGNRPMAQPSQQTNDEAHWSKTTNLMFTHLGIWLFFGYIIHMFVVPLNKIIIPVLNFPLGFYMAAQGSLIVFVVMLFVFAKQQDSIDREFGVAEDD
jgi:putative solute:sodium symporter small subunit